MLGDCLERMKEIPYGLVDMILCDLPYGTTACKWDVVIPFEPLWEQYRRISKQNSAIVLFATQPFTSALVMSNPNDFKESLVWKKHKPSNFAQGNKRHLKYHEDILVFSSGVFKYNPQRISRTSDRVKKAQEGNSKHWRTTSNINFKGTQYQPEDWKKYNPETKLPMSIIEYPAVSSTSKDKTPHPAQKPVTLLGYLVKTYTIEGEIVLDNTMGSGSTGVVCVNTNRRFIGIEKDEKYFEIAQNRIQAAKEAEETRLRQQRAGDR